MLEKNNVFIMMQINQTARLLLTTTQPQRSNTTGTQQQQRTDDGHLGRRRDRCHRFGGHGARFGCDGTADSPRSSAEEHPGLELFLAGDPIILPSSFTSEEGPTSTQSTTVSIVVCI